MALILAVIGALLLAGATVMGMVIYFVTRTMIRRGRQAKEVLVRTAAALGTGEGAEAERLRQRLRREVAATRKAIEEASRRGWQVGELPARIHEVAGMADRLDAQLAVLATAHRASPSATGGRGEITRLRASVAKVVDACRDMRSALLTSDVELHEHELDEVLARVRIEAESLRAAGGLDSARAPGPELAGDPAAPPRQVDAAPEPSPGPSEASAEAAVDPLALRGRRQALAERRDAALRRVRCIGEAGERPGDPAVDVASAIAEAERACADLAAFDAAHPGVRTPEDAARDADAERRLRRYGGRTEPRP